MAHWSYVCPDLSRCNALALLISSRGAASHQLMLNTAEWALRPLPSLPPWFASDTMVIIQVSIPLLLLTWISLWVLMFKLLNFAVFLPEMQKIKPQPFWSTCAGWVLVPVSVPEPDGSFWCYQVSTAQEDFDTCSRSGAWPTGCRFDVGLFMDAFKPTQISSLTVLPDQQKTWRSTTDLFFPSQRRFWWAQTCQKLGNGLSAAAPSLPLASVLQSCPVHLSWDVPLILFLPTCCDHLCLRVHPSHSAAVPEKLLSLILMALQVYSFPDDNVCPWLPSLQPSYDKLCARFLMLVLYCLPLISLMLFSHKPWPQAACYTVGWLPIGQLSFLDLTAFLLPCPEGSRL